MLSDEFYREVTAHSIPTDLEAAGIRGADGNQRSSVPSPGISQSDVDQLADLVPRASALILSSAYFVRNNYILRLQTNSE